MREEPQVVRSVFGFLLASVGILLLLGNLGLLHLDFSRLWPLFPLGAGVAFLGLHFIDGTPRTRWALIPGSIVVNVGLILFLIAFDLVDMAVFWPIFPFGVGLAFLMMFAMGIREENWPLYPGSILVGLSVIFFITTSLGWRWWPLLLILGGVVVLFRRN